MAIESFNALDAAAPASDAGALSGGGALDIICAAQASRAPVRGRSSGNHYSLVARSTGREGSEWE